MSILVECEASYEVSFDATIKRSVTVMHSNTKVRI